MQFFTSLVLNRIGVTLQVIDVFMQAVVFLLKLLHLLLEQLCFFALVCEGSETVVSEDDAIGHNKRQDGSRKGSGAATPKIDAVLRSSGKLGQFDSELRFGWRGSQLRASAGRLRANRSLEVSRIRALVWEGKLWKEPDLSTAGSKIVFGAPGSFLTSSFVILRVTHARPLLHFDTGLSSTALGFVRNGATCTTGPALPP